MNGVSYEEIEHTADWSFRVRGQDLKQLFTNAAHALVSMEGGQAGGAATTTREVEVEGVDRETLLVNWLNEVLHLQHTHRELYQSFDIVEISDTHLRARLHGHAVGEMRTVIKGVTFHNLEVKQTDGVFEATLVVDV